MSVKIGQIKRTKQLSAYQTDITNQYIAAFRQFKWSQNKICYELSLALENGQKFKAGQTYHFNVINTYIDNLLGRHSSFTAKLINISGGTTISSQMTIGRFSAGSSTEFCFTPNRNYSYLVFSVEDTDLQAVDDVPKEIGKLHKLHNLFTIEESLKEIQRIKKVGIQGPPNLNFSINGEDFIMGKTGIFMISGVDITNISFFLKENTSANYPNYVPYFSATADSKYEFFIMDYEYEED